jgi:hypothetical protein
VALGGLLALVQEGHQVLGQHLVERIVLGLAA